MLKRASISASKALRHKGYLDKTVSVRLCIFALLVFSLSLLLIACLPLSLPQAAAPSVAMPTDSGGGLDLSTFPLISPTAPTVTAGVTAEANTAATATVSPTRTPSITTRIKPTRASTATATRRPTAIGIRRSTATSSTGIDLPSAPSSGLPTIQVGRLPKEALDTIALILKGGPFPYHQDGVVFQNRERILPRNASGYYHEYTVKTPGSPDRGPRRIITGDRGEFFYTDDHYASFKQVVP